MSNIKKRENDETIIDAVYVHRQLRIDNKAEINNVKNSSQ